MLTTQIPSKATPEINDQVIGNADTGQSSMKTRTFSLSSLFSNMTISTLRTGAKTIIGAINEIHDGIISGAIVGVDDDITQSDVNNIFN